ncbi:hypothetical protein ABK040_008285 [Willaertia magna]
MSQHSQTVLASGFNYNYNLFLGHDNYIKPLTPIHKTIHNNSQNKEETENTEQPLLSKYLDSSNNEYITKIIHSTTDDYQDYGYHGHSFLLTSKGRVFGCGDTTGKGELGPNETSNDKYFKIIEFTKRVKDIVCGFDFTIFVTTDNELYGCGNGYYLFNSTKDYHYNIDKLNIKEKVKTITCGDSHFLFVTENRKVYGCGSNTFGQIPFAQGQDLYKFTELFQLVDFLKKEKAVPKSIFCQAKYTTIFTTDYRIVYSGKLGTSVVKKPAISQPFPFLKERILQTVPTRESIGFLTKKQNVYILNFKNNYKEIFQIKKVEFETPQKIVKMTGGDLHYIFITNQGEILGMGNNRYGQLGIGSNYLEFEENAVHEKPIKVFNEQLPRKLNVERDEIWCSGNAPITLIVLNDVDFNPIKCFNFTKVRQNYCDIDFLFFTLQTSSKTSQ